MAVFFHRERLLPLDDDTFEDSVWGQNYSKGVDHSGSYQNVRVQQQQIIAGWFSNKKAKRWGGRGAGMHVTLLVITLYHREFNNVSAIDRRDF